jgi:hypothetical protein
LLTIPAAGDGQRVWHPAVAMSYKKVALIVVSTILASVIAGLVK